jgi:hypothetical protein
MLASKLADLKDRRDKAMTRFSEALDRQTNQALREKLEHGNHGNDGTHELSAANYEGRVWQCLCGEQFEGKGELEEHLAESTA